MVKFQRWDGTGFKQVTPFMAGDRAMVRKMVEESAAQVRGGEEDHAARLHEGRCRRASARVTVASMVGAQPDPAPRRSRSRSTTSRSSTIT